ncbi:MULTISPECIES: hypothetical protein [Mycolicibacterium]|uniref:Integral membrane protein n=2 Tax=Mycolicibacterium gilvum TaxID=1804 RepID=E6TDW1_MYCSR|nr:MULTISPECIES: hypothetical protein [Mycolicibacterium]ADT98752.1 hypothetical protein Mspyr1_20980 [Mycolicibacterium gilvum Spyr1]STZ44548.1 Uncharacterised protein [Mycolicibacterium gilvum]
MNRRAPLIAGVAFAVLYATAVLLIPSLPGPDAGLVRTQALLLTFSALAVVVVLAFARDRLAGPAAHLFTIGSAVTVTQLCVSVWFIAGSALRPGQVTVGTALAIDDVGAMWLPVVTVANILVAAPILLAANEGELPRWLGTAAAVFTVEQLIETITIIGPPGSFISPGGPMNHYLGGTLTAAFYLALGVALALPDRPAAQAPHSASTDGPATEMSAADPA